MPKTDYLEDKLINWLRGTAFGAAPTSLHLALFTADPGEAGSLTNEVADANYARQTVSLTAPSSRPVNLTADAVFPAAAGPSYTITHAAIVDAASAGNILYRAALTVARTINAGQVFRVPAADLDLDEL